MYTDYALELTSGVAFDMLGELADLYDDNGGGPDGNLWLPREPVEFNDGYPLVFSGYAKWTRAFFYDDMNDVGEMLHTLRLATTVEAVAEQDGRMDEINDAYYDILRDALYINTDLGKIVGWAGYGNGQSIVVVW